MKKTVWLMNHYANHMLFDKGGRHYFFAKYLNRSGYKPIIFCANTVNNNPQNRYFETEDLWTIKEAKEINTPFVYVKARRYSGNGKDRILNMVDFYFNVKIAAKQFASHYGKPDLIIASSVHPLTMVAGINLAKYFNVKCICEVRDLWPEAIVAYSDKIDENSCPAKLMYKGERWIYQNASAVIFTQEGGPVYVKEKGWSTDAGGTIDPNKLYHINNGVDLETFYNNLNNYVYDDVDLNNPNIFKVVYCGSIRRINNLGIIVDAAKLITDEEIKFIIFGDGDELDSLKRRVVDEKINNVVFKGRVNKQFIPSIVSRANLNLVHWEMNPLLKVGESYNKAFEYYAAAKPVFYTIRPGYSIAEKYNAGIITSGFSPKEIADGITHIKNLDEHEIKSLSNNAKKVAEDYDFEKLTNQLISIIESL